MSDCRSVRALAPELALGIASGEDRASALRHLAGCAECRRDVESLALVADELLLLAPEVDPPVGFESRMAERLSGAATPARGRRWAVLAGAAALIAVIAGAGVYLVTAPDRHLADYYRRQLASAHGRYFVTSALYGPGARVQGEAFGYEGDPSWLLLTADRGLARGTYRVHLVTVTGGKVAVGRMRVDSGGSWGRAIPFDLSNVRSVTLTSPNGDVALEADLRQD